MSYSVFKFSYLIKSIDVNVIELELELELVLLVFRRSCRSTKLLIERV